MTHVDWIIVAVYLSLNLVIGALSGKGVKDFTIFSVGHRNFTSFVIFCTLSASFIGGGYTIGSAGKVYSSGMIYAFALLGFSVKEILVGVFIAPRMGNFQECLSVGDIIAKSYGKLPQIITGIFAILICAGILGAQINALTSLFGTFFPEVNTDLCVLISFLVILVYCTLGGMRAVVYTDVLQFAILAVGIPLIFFFGLHSIGGWHVLATKIPTDQLLPFGSSHQIYTLLGLFIAFVFGEILVPPYVQRLFMTKPSATRRGTIISGVFSVPFFLITGAIGLISLVANPDIDPNLALPYAILNLTPAVLRGFLVAALVAIIMSSAAGFLNAASVAFINDVLQPIANNKIHKKKLLGIAKVTTVLVGLLSLVFAMGLNNALDILLFSYNLWSPIILVPLLAAIFGCQLRKEHFLAGAIAGFISAMLWLHFTKDTLFLSSATFGIIINLIFFMIAKRAFPALKQA